MNNQAPPPSQPPLSPNRKRQDFFLAQSSVNSESCWYSVDSTMSEKSSRPSSKVKFILGDNVSDNNDTLNGSFSSLSSNHSHYNYFLNRREQLRRQSKVDSLTHLSPYGQQQQQQQPRKASSLYHDPIRPLKGELANMAESDRVLSHSMPGNLLYSAKSNNVANYANNRGKFLQVPGAANPQQQPQSILAVKSDSPFPSRRRCRSTTDVEDECCWFICANCSRVVNYSE